MASGFLAKKADGEAEMRYDEQSIVLSTKKKTNEDYSYLLI